LLAPEAIFIFKKAQFADAQNILTKGWKDTVMKNFGKNLLHGFSNITSFPW
jgi:hypothetical protein